MRNLLSNTAAKIVAVILFTLSATVLIMATAMVDIFYYPEAYSNTDWQSQIYVTFVGDEYLLITLFIISGIFFLASLLFLLFAAGHRKGEDKIVLNSLDKIPLDLYLVVDGLLCYLFARLMNPLINNLGFTVIIVLFTFSVLVLLLLAFLLTLATRIKHGRWWENTIICKIILQPMLKFLRWLGRQIRLIFNNMAILWKVIIVCIIFAILAIIFMSNAYYGSGLAVFLLLVLAVAAILFISMVTLQMDTLRKGASQLAAGNLDYRIDTRNMFHDLKMHGEDLNRISEGLALAVEERMKSEHFKTELITNVSHDLKTPLTSIINYVDLLSKEQIDNPKAQEYLEVLARQSARLKKLTEDLIEASKASTGNIKMELGNTEIGEFINQIMGEYQERFNAAGLQSVVTLPEERMVILADGRSLWRVFDNLLNNICKYSQPQTRVFIDVKATREKVIIALKNTSRDLLNIPVESLLERFVRADSARTTEGSGLGLSIARSLTELQNGSLELSVDGDLFKVTITFNRIYD